MNTDLKKPTPSPPKKNPTNQDQKPKPTTTAYK